MKDKNKSQKVIGFQVVENECIWMKGGIVNFKLCDNVYDCPACPFDKAMQKAMASKMEDHEEYLYGKDSGKWAGHMVSHNKADQRLCRHAVTGRIGAPKICPNNYECSHCEYDQWLDETDCLSPLPATNSLLASGYAIYEGYYFHRGHTWARFEHGGKIRVGFDDFLVKLFGPMEALSLPALGKMLKQGETGLEFMRQYNRAKAQSPVSGTVLMVNHNALKTPEVITRDPYNEGWLFIVEPDLPIKNTRNLLFGKQVFDWMEKEHRKLLSILGKEYQDLAATGGRSIDDIFGSIPDLDWVMLAEQFLSQ